jgi:hypothetical protein
MIVIGYGAMIRPARHPARRAIARKAGQAGGAGGVESYLSPARRVQYDEAGGNFPQAFTHLSLINAAITLDHQLDHGVGFDPVRRVNAAGAG